MTGREKTVCGLIVTIVVTIGLLYSIFVPAVSYSRQAMYRNRCTCHGKQLGMALLNYHDINKSFPPAFVVDATGKPMHSWRVLVLPYLEEIELYRQYDFNEPWNGPHNSRLSDMMPSQYRCPMANTGSNETSYVAVVGSETAWPEDAARTIGEIRDGISKTIMLVEVVDSGINWLEPRDLSFEQALQGINPLGKKPAISSHHEGGAIVIFGDAHVKFLRDDLGVDVLRGLLTASGRDDVVIPSD